MPATDVLARRRARRSARRPARPARRGGRAALRPRRDRGRSRSRTAGRRRPRQVPWLEAVFAPWLERIAAEAGAPVVGIAGNRDFAWWWDRRVFEKLPWTYICDERGDGRRRARVRIALVPAAPRAAEGRRAAAALAAAAAGREGAALAAARARRRVHGGRRGRARRALRGDPRGHRRPAHAHAAARARRPHGDRRARRLDGAARGDRARQPPLAVFGHIHEGRGEPTRAGRTLCANSAICDRWFERRNQPWLIDIDLAARSRGARRGRIVTS